MILQKDRVEFFQQNWTLDAIRQHCEKCGRVCYKSENKLDGQHTDAFINSLIKSKHYSVLEHGTVYLTKTFNTITDKIDSEFATKYILNKYSVVNIDVSQNYDYTLYITTNYRVIVENGWENDLEYITAPTEYHEKRYTLFLSVDRGVGEEFLRHRPFSYSKESTRYCRYSLDKFGNQITYILPEADLQYLEEGEYTLNEYGDICTKNNYNDSAADNATHDFLKLLLDAEKTYMNLINHGWTAQQARRVLPLAVKGDFVMTGFESDWQHVIDLRYHETTGKVHPDMMHIAEKIYKLFKDNNINIK